MRKPFAGHSSIGEPESGMEAVLASAKLGDHVAFTAIWHELNPRVSRFVQFKTYGSRIDYEDVVSETWLGVAKDIRKFNGDFKELTSWIFTIARNRIVDAARKRDRSIVSSDLQDEAYWLPSSTDLESDFQAAEGVQEIVGLINQLPPAQAEVVLLRVVSDLTVEETAKILKKSANSVRVLSHRGLESLREMIGGANEKS